MRRFTRFGGAWCFLLASVAFGQSATIDNIGWIDIDNPQTAAYAVSADGQVVAGYSGAANQQRHVARWTSAAGLQDLGSLAPGSEGTIAQADEMSANGNVLVGYAEINGQPNFTARAIRIAGGIQQLGSLAGADVYDASRAFACSADGNIVVGWSDVDPTYSRAFRWQNNSMISLGTIGNAAGYSAAFDCSADGRVIVGRSFNGSVDHAARFVVGSPVQDLGSLSGASAFSYAEGISRNGNIVVGYSFKTGSGFAHPMYWTASTNMRELPIVDGVAGGATALGVNANGSMIVGSSANAGRPGGYAAVWINGKPRQLYDLLTKDYKLELPGWTTLDVVNDVSHDGRTLVGQGTGFGGATVGFRVRLTPNSLPTVDALKPAQVECDGGRTRVTLTTRVRDADLADRLTVVWLVNNVVKKTQTGVAGGTSVLFAYDFPDDASVVQVRVTDGKGEARSSTTVTVVDTKDPIIIVAADVTKRVDPGKKFATVTLKKPQVTDICDPTPTVTNNAPSRYPIGVTRVRWTVRDDHGNVATAVQKVTILNAAPTASAGSDVARTTKQTTVKVSLDGSKSRDADEHKLTYRWSAPGTTFDDPTSARATARFPVGKTQVRLTVTDIAGEESTDVVTIEVKKLRSARTAAAIADASAHHAYVIADSSFYATGSDVPVGDATSAAGLESAAYARFLGTLAGDELDARYSQDDEAAAYAELRYRQAAAAKRAGDQFAESYATGGDLNAFVASMYAYSASSYALADLASTERVDLLVAGVDEGRP